MTGAPPVLKLDARAADGTPELVLGPEDDPRAVALADLAVIGIAFAPFRDGRGYSHARILRERGFSGDLRAVGDVTLDQILFLARVGFSSVAPERPIDGAAAHAALERFGAPYQRGRPGEAMAWQRRAAAGRESA
ncbi:MAG: DUF934 domain-containing protein [Thermaurantiacus sp.]